MKHLFAACVVMFLIASQLLGQAEKERAKLEAIIRADATLTVSAIDRWDLPQNVDRASREQRLARLRNDWNEFLRSKTKEGKTDSTRLLESATFWREFFGAMPDDLAVLVDRQAGYTSKIAGALKGAKLKVELESDAAVRSQMLGRIEAAQKDLEGWHKYDNNSRSARNRLVQSLPALIRPL